TCMETAGEGGPYGMALLASYRANRADGETLEDFLSGKVFAGVAGTTLQPDAEDVAGFDRFLTRYKAGLAVEQKASETL
ncbi:MAG: ATPase, partial [Clostridiales bacterium]|nr:ATPase [Clostridiales bacterium]